jgi:hypothetical protein
MPWKITLTGTGPIPSISTEEVIVVPPVDPPKPPPDPDPGLPFVWPPEYVAAVDPAARYAWWWLVPGKSEWDSDGKAYAYQAGTGNAVGVGYHNAGIITSGRWIGLRLWAATSAPGAFLRAILAGQV